MKEIIGRMGYIPREVTPGVFRALVISIISQQISGKAADTITGRLTALVGELTPGSIARTTAEDIQRCGMSMRKAEYIRSAADAALSGAVDFDALAALPDEAVIESLVSLRGVGRWTAEMLLIFSLCRPDVLSYDDLGIRRGIMRLYGLKELSRAQFEIYRKRYHPCGTVASFYLWAIAAE